MYTDEHTHTHTDIYIYISVVCVCVDVCWKIQVEFFGFWTVLLSVILIPRFASDGGIRYVPIIFWGRSIFIFIGTLTKCPGCNLILLGAYNANTVFDSHSDFGLFVCLSTVNFIILFVFSLF